MSNNNKNPHVQKTSKGARQVRSGIIGSLYPRLVRGMAPGGGDGPPPPGGGNLPPDQPDDEEREEEGEDTDEETESVTSSSQGSTVKIKHHQWKGAGMGYGSGAGGPPEDPNDHPSGERGAIGKVNVGPGAIGVSGVGLDPQVKMETRDQWDP